MSTICQIFLARKKSDVRSRLPSKPQSCNPEVGSAGAEARYDSGHARHGMTQQSMIDRHAIPHARIVRDHRRSPATERSTPPPQLRTAPTPPIAGIARKWTPIAKHGGCREIESDHCGYRARYVRIRARHQAVEDRWAPAYAVASLKDGVLVMESKPRQRQATRPRCDLRVGQHRSGEHSQRTEPAHPPARPTANRATMSAVAHNSGSTATATSRSCACRNNFPILAICPSGSLGTIVIRRHSRSPTCRSFEPQPRSTVHPCQAVENRRVRPVHDYLDVLSWRRRTCGSRRLARQGDAGASYGPLPPSTASLPLGTARPRSTQTCGLALRASHG